MLKENLLCVKRRIGEGTRRVQRSGCIEESNSPYTSALVLVRKKGGGLRICVDYRALNRDTVPDKYPIPRIDELIDRVGACKAKIFSALDLMKGYHQMKVRDEDKLKTVFVCHQGLYQYRRMPFGLINAPATFQRLIDKVFNKKRLAAKRVVSQGHRGYYVVDGILYHEDATMPSRRRLVVPIQLREQVLTENHDAVYAGHFAAKKMYQKVSQYYFWPDMKGDM